MYNYFYSGIDAVSENTGNTAQSGSSDLNQMNLDSTDRMNLSTSKKKDSYNKDTMVPTYADGTINYDGIMLIYCILL